MSVFEQQDFDEHEQVAFCCDAAARLRMIVAIHRAGPLGPAGGGCRMLPYIDERAAVRDALRLSRVMTYKLALLEIPAGGAKAVVIGEPMRDKSEALLLAIGRAVERFGGRFVLAADVGIEPGDLAVVARATKWVNPGSEDTAWPTAYGVMVGMRVAARLRLGRRDLAGMRVAVQGVGRVGRELCRLLREAGVRLSVSDCDARRAAAVARECGAELVPPDAILDQEVDLFAPCAVADAIDAGGVSRLRCAIVAGSANNQLADSRLADALAARGILYAPDFVMNAGGALAGAFGNSREERILRARLEEIGALLEKVLLRAERDGISTHAAAEAMAKERLRGLGVRA